MTKEEARAIASGAYSAEKTHSGSIIAVLETLGLIKFDEPAKPAWAKFTNAWIKYTNDPHERLSLDQVRNILYDTGLELTEKKK